MYPLFKYLRSEERRRHELKYFQLRMRSGARFDFMILAYKYKLFGQELYLTTTTIVSLVIVDYHICYICK